MKKLFLLILFIPACSWIFFSCSENQMNNNNPPEEKLNVLIFSKTAGFRHESIEPGAAAMKAYFDANGISSVHTEDSSVFNGNGLSAYDVIIFLNTTGNILDSNQQKYLTDHVKAGKGFVGIHSAADTEYDWPWYGGLVGAYFASHPQIQQAAVVKMDTSHISC